MSDLDDIRVRARIVLPPTSISLGKLAKLQPARCWGLTAAPRSAGNGVPSRTGVVARREGHATTVPYFKTTAPRFHLCDIGQIAIPG